MGFFHRMRPPPNFPPTRPLNRLGGPSRQARGFGRAASSARIIDDLRRYQSELESQNSALRFSQAVAEGASERFVTLFSTVPLALMVVDESGQVLEHNARALALLRPLESDPPLNFLFPLLKAAHVYQIMYGFETAVMQGTCELNELVFDGGSNGLITGDLHIASIDHAPEEPPSFICAIIDQGPLLSQRQALLTSAQALKERNDELSQSKNRLAAIIDSSLDAIICVNQHLRIVVFNPSAATIFECQCEQALGQALTNFLPDAAQACLKKDIAQQPQLGEMMGITRKGGTVPLDVSVSFERQPDGDIITLFAHDLTNRKKMESQRVALESQLRESQKMQAVGTMAGGIAHDFNNIIGAILGNVDIAKQDVESNAPVLVCLAEIEKAGRRARNLVRQILTFSRNDPPRRVPLQLADVVHETMRLVKVTLPPNVEMQAQIDPATPLVLADATQIAQALLNLCTNAIHAIGTKSGIITIELCLDKQDVSADKTSDSPKKWVKLLVTDTGSGMIAETLERVFEPFFTTKPVGQGTGLGLSVVHGIMRSHSGSIEVQSTPGVGSQFSLRFPVAEGVSIETTIAPASAQVKGCGQRVMYVDDDEALVFLVKRVLTRKGFEVHTFTDPKAALEAIRADPLQLDLLLTDFNMPGYSGVELLRDVKSIRPDLPVALASGYVTPEIEQAARHAGARALIHKPNDVDELCSTVQKLLDGKHNRSWEGGVA